MMLFRPEFVEPILRGKKTNTRRMGPPRWKAGSFHQARINYNTDPFAYLYVWAVGLERLDEMGQDEIEAAGFDSKEAYRECYLGYFPTYSGELYRVEFVAITKEEYEHKILADDIPEGTMVKLITDGVVNRLHDESLHDYKNNGCKYEVMTTPVMLRGGKMVAHLLGMRGYYDTMKMHPVSYPTHGAKYVEVVEDEIDIFHDCMKILHKHAHKMVVMKPSNIAAGGYTGKSDAQLNQGAIMNSLADRIFNVYEKYYNNDDAIRKQLDHLEDELQELREAIEEDREVNIFDCDLHTKGEIDYSAIHHTIQDELADILIIVLGFCRYYGMTMSDYDIAWHINWKMLYNVDRLREGK